MTVTSLVVVIAPCTGKIIKNGGVFERGENLLLKWDTQKVRIYTDEKTERGLAL